MERVLRPRGAVNLSKAAGNVGLALAAGLVAVVVAEGILRLLDDGRYYIWPPHLSHESHPDPALLPGVSGLARFSTGPEGLRWEAAGSGDRLQILAVGGSTTECFYLDDTETWTAVMQAELSARLAPRGVWVGNGGRSGRSARHHVVQLRELSRQYPWLDAVVVLVGANDLGRRLASDDDWRAEPAATESPEVYRQAFARHPGWRSDLPLYQRAALWRLARGVAFRVLPSEDVFVMQDDTGGQLVRWRRYRLNAPRLRNALPDLTQALAEYRHHLTTLAAVARERSVTLVLATQPTLWRGNLSPREDSLLWFGGLGSYQSRPGSEYYSARALEEGMERFNEVVREVCAAQGLSCADLARLLPKDTTIFYDDMHFTEAGARQVGGVIAEAVRFALGTGTRVRAQPAQ